MVKQNFRTERLRTELEVALRCKIAELVRLPGHAWSLNFKAVRASDALPFLVKLTPNTFGDRADEAELRKRYDNLTRHLADLVGSKAVHELFPEAPREILGYRLRCLSWCAGVQMTPDMLTERQLADFLANYLEFSERMQGTDGLLPARDGSTMLSSALLLGRRFPCSLLLRILRADMPPSDIRHRKELLKIVHGDFHHGNFLFENGKCTGIFDLEEFRYGYPTEDIVRYFTCAAEHLRWYEFGRSARILKAFAKAVDALPYTAHEWTVAVNIQFLFKVCRKLRRGGGILQTGNLFFRYAFYRRMRRLGRASRWSEPDI